MADLKIIKRGTLKRGVTLAIAYVFTPPYEGYDWSTVKADMALTNVTAPADNSGALALRSNQTLTVDADNKATALIQLTIAESKLLVPGSTYHDECKLTENNIHVIKPVTGELKIAQDYVI